jgi:hypothetical protein
MPPPKTRTKIYVRSLRVMMLRSLLRLAMRASLVALATASVAVGCSRQGEGERCDLVAAGHDDCDSGLICIACEDLADRVTSRCCPPSGSSDPRCARSTAGGGVCLTQLGSGGSAGSSSGGAGSSGAGAGGVSAGGTAGTAGTPSGGTAGEDDPAGAGGA